MYQTVIARWLLELALPVGRITQAAVNALLSSERDFILWDESLKGFGVKITPKGARVYLVQYRMGGRGAPTVRITIGRHGVWTAPSARERAGTLLRDASIGADPRAAIAASKVEVPTDQLGQSPLFGLYAEKFLTSYGQREWRPKTLLSRKSDMGRWVIPVLGKVPIKQIGRKHLTDALDALPQASPALPRSVFALMRKTFAWAVERGDLERNPADGMKSPKPVKARERTLNSSELRSVLLAAGGLNEPFASLVRVLAISGQRLREVSEMAWSELNQVQRVWTIPGSRTKNGVTHSVPINDVLARELVDLAGAGPWPKSGLVFTTNGTSPVSDFSGMKRRLDAIAFRQNGSAISPWRLHDLRRSFATNLQKLDVRWEVIEALLNHVGTSKGGVAGVYQRHDWFEEKIVAMRLWDEALRDIVLSEIEG